MVIVLNHLIISGYLFCRDKFWFRGERRPSTGNSNMVGNESVQEAILRLSAVLKHEQLEQALVDALHLALPNVKDVVVYVQTTDEQDLVSSRGLLHPMPKEGMAWEAVQRRERLQVTEIGEADPLSGLLESATRSHTGKVVCSPVVDQETNKVLAVLFIVCDELSKDDQQHLTFLEKQLVICMKRLKQTSQLVPRQSSIQSSNTSSPVNTNAILNLCAELYDQDAASLQLKVIKYLQNHTGAESGFLLLVAPEHRELICQVIGDRVLDEELRFSHEENSFATVIKTKRPITEADIDEDHRKDIEGLLGHPIHSLLCVPVLSKVNNEVIAIQCLLNKQNSDKFCQEDIDVIEHCYTYTAPVLHSTLAVQNERRIKKQTQTLLQVAKNLFTHLGKYFSTKVEEYETSCISVNVNKALAPSVSGKIQHIQMETSDDKTMVTREATDIATEKGAPTKGKGKGKGKRSRSQSQGQKRTAEEISGNNSEPGSPTKIVKREFEDEADNHGVVIAPDSPGPVTRSMVKQGSTPSSPATSARSRSRAKAGMGQNSPGATTQSVLRGSAPSSPGPTTRSRTKGSSTPNSPECTARAKVKTSLDSKSPARSKVRERSTASSPGPTTRSKVREDSVPNSPGPTTRSRFTNSPGPKIRSKVKEESAVNSPQSAKGSGHPSKPVKSGKASTSQDTPQKKSKRALMEHADSPVLLPHAVPERMDLLENIDERKISKIPIQTSSGVSRPHSAQPGTSRQSAGVGSGKKKGSSKSRPKEGSSGITSQNRCASVEPGQGRTGTASPCPHEDSSIETMISIGGQMVDVRPCPECLSLALSSNHATAASGAKEVSRGPCVSSQSSAESIASDVKEMLNTAFLASSSESLVSPSSSEGSVHHRAGHASPTSVSASARSSSSSNMTIIVEDTETSQWHSMRTTIKGRQYECTAVEGKAYMCRPVATGNQPSSKSPRRSPRKHGNKDSSKATTSKAKPIQSISTSSLSSTSSYESAQSECTDEDEELAWVLGIPKQKTFYPTPTPRVEVLDQDDLTILLREIIQEARNLTKAERCSVFLLERQTNELVAKVFDGQLTESGQEQNQTEVRISASQGIAGHVVTTGEMLNIDDAYSHPLFYRGVDESTGFRTRNILCFPIKDEKDVIIGVAQLCNKINGAGFSSFDEQIAQAFAIYCCISIAHSLLYQKVRQSQIRSQLSSELMVYHMQVSNEEVGHFAQQVIPGREKYGPEFATFSFVPRSLAYDDTIMAVLFMLEDMNFINKFKIPSDSLCRFVLMVRKGYRDPPYHNWSHAFAVAHFCYLMYKNLHLMDFLSELEIFALFIASLCHDIDHRGTTNSYQVASGSVLAALYSSEGSVMERHHFAQTMCILNLNECNIFENLSRTDYSRILDLMRDIILATDLAHHLRIVKDLEKIAKDGYDGKKPQNRMLLLCLLMTSCDLSDQTKNWRNTKKIAELIYQEFFSQGDLEKAFGRKPIEMMDREKAYIPELQVGFLDSIALPVFRILADIFPESKPVLTGVENNRKNWVKMNDKIQQLQLISNSSLDILDIDIDV